MQRKTCTFTNYDNCRFFFSFDEEKSSSPKREPKDKCYVERKRLPECDEFCLGCKSSLAFDPLVALMADDIASVNGFTKDEIQTFMSLEVV